MSETGSPRPSRKLAAILAADIAGYSALMGADEARTVADLKGHQAVVLPMIAQHGGRVIDTAGDGILAEFASVVNAVECAVAIQKIMTGRNVAIEEPRRMRYRIGIDLGDVVYDDARVYGDGVNIAARLESIAEPGGICLSAVVHDQVRTRLPFSFTDLGEKQLKNIAQLVRVYRIDGDRFVPSSPVMSSTLILPDKPSIAVLPFTNLSGDPKEDYFSDGISEDIITELSRFSELFVIARNSSFQYKGKSPDIRQVGRELGVHYVLEGSVRRLGERLRISAQLADAAKGTHRWAERYDRRLEDVFALQDDVVGTIVAMLAAHVRKAEIERTRTKPPASWEAYDYYLQAADAHASFLLSFSAEPLYETRRLLQQSLFADPDYARSYALLARTHIVAWSSPLDSDYLNPGVLDEAYQLARKAVQLDGNLPLARAALAHVLAYRRQHEASLMEIEKAFALNPNYVDWQIGFALVVAGQSRRAVAVLEACMRLDPFYAPVASGVLGFAHYMLKQYAQALPALRDCVSRAPNLRAGHSWLAATYAQMGQLEEARAALAEAPRIQSNYTISDATRRILGFKSAKDEEHYYDGLRKAGLLD